MRIALTSLDMVIGEGVGLSGPVIPEDYRNLPLTNLRYIDGKITDVSNHNKFYIDGLGNKHAIQNDEWQELECSVADNLINENGLWSKKTDTHYLSDAKEKAISEMVKFADDLTETVLRKYSKAEQLSFPERLLEAKNHQQGVMLSDGSILKKLSNISGKSLDDISAAVILKANEFNLITANITLIREQGEAAISEATSIEELEPIKSNLKSTAETIAQDLGLL